jgi:ferredoxin
MMTPHENTVHSVRVEPEGLQYDVEGDLTLLEAADFGRVQLPSSCRNGTCRTCMCRLLSGEVRYDIEWPGLSAEEHAEGWILPCVAKPCSNLVIEQNAASAS